MRKKIFILIAFLTAAFGIVYMLCVSKNDTAYIDVRENDGRYVIWRENDYYRTDGDLVFTCRDGIFTKVFVSYDGGRSYRDETGNYIRDQQDSITVSEEKSGNAAVCLRFRTRTDQSEKNSRDYRIDYGSRKTVSETED